MRADHRHELVSLKKVSLVREGQADRSFALGVLRLS